MILVAGATGRLGFEIVQRLRSRGEDVRGLVRATSAPEKIAAIRNAGAEVYTGNLRDKASLEAACKGVDTVISTATVIVTAQPGDSFQDTDSAGTIALIEAAKHAGVSHFIFVSFEASRFPDTPLTHAKRTVEQHLQEGGIDYTILQPPPFMEIWLGPMMFGDPRSGEVKIFGEGEGKIPYVSLYDVAEVAVRCVHASSARNRTIVFTGPQGVTQREVVKMFEQAIGKPLIVNAVPQQALEEMWKSADNPHEKSFAGLMLGLSMLDEEPTPLSEEYAFEMATVGDYAKKTTQSS